MKVDQQMSSINLKIWRISAAVWLVHGHSVLYIKVSLEYFDAGPVFKQS